MRLPARIVSAVTASAGAPRARLTDYFTPEDIARASRYRGPNYAYAFGALALSLVVLGVLASPVCAGLRARLGSGRWPLAGLRITALVTIVPLLFTLPLDVARWRHERAFGLATNTFGGYLSDVGKSAVFSFVIAAVGVLAFVGITRALPRAWPFVAALTSAILLFVLVFLLPVVYEPAFNTFRPADPAVTQRVLALAEKEGVKVRDVLVADASRRTRKQNAYVSGLGNTKRVVLYDTLLLNQTPRAVDIVVAHELAHDKHHDVLTQTLLGIAGAWLGIAVLFWLVRWAPLRTWARLDGPGDPRVVAFLAFFFAVASLVTLPVANAMIRQMEARADRTAIAVTNDPPAAIELERSLALSNIADLTPNGFIRWMFFTHPATLERIQFALDYEVAHRT